MSQLPSMPVWISDFFSKTDHLSNEEQWAYLKLMMKTWVRNCKPIPDSDSDIARLLNMTVKRWRIMRPRIAPFFDLSESSWRQLHLEDLFREASERNEINVSRASAGGRAKARKFNELSLLEASLGRPSSIATKSIKKDSEPPRGVSDAGAPAIDPIKELWNRGKAVLGNSTGAASVLGKLRREHGDAAVMEAIVAAESELPSDPVSFIIGCLNRRRTNGHGHKQSPAEKFLEGAYRAVEAREAHRRADLEADDPLLDC